MSLEQKISRLVPERLQKLEPYKTDSASGLVKLDAMELPFPIDAAVSESLYRALAEVELNRYPEARPKAIRNLLLSENRLANKVDVVLGNGSDELIHLLCLMMRKTDQSTVLCPSPTFSVYRIAAEIVGLRYTEMDNSYDDFSLDFGHMMTAIERDEPALIFLASPNNPTGSTISKAEIEAICRKSKGLVVLDEAYWRFAGESLVYLTEMCENLLVLQTFSKIGFAGLRVGMLFGQKPWIDLIEKIRMPYNVNSLSQAGALFALNNKALIEGNIDRVKKERNWMFDQLSKINSVKVWPSEANFFLIRLIEQPGSLMFAQLKNKGFLVKNLTGSHPALMNCLRVTIGTREENIGFLSALRELCH